MLSLPGVSRDVRKKQKIERGALKMGTAFVEGNVSKRENFFDVFDKHRRFNRPKLEIYFVVRVPLGFIESTVWSPAFHV